MEFVNKLFKYRYENYNQGSIHTHTEYALLNVPEDATFNNNVATLVENRHVEYYHEIDISSVEDLTIKF